ncbi:ParB N-terminal domain-containing protein [Paracoccaceae bacterium Fryx2]|nr:ParB N-terminal domain-containing protein [Paracoccaceae bacterium Fryx2]
MAKRRRLTPARDDYFDGPAPETKAMYPLGVAPAPIARVTGDAAATAALREVTAELTAARSEGRMVLRLDLAAIEEAWLVRDRLGNDAEELESLMASLRSHGQRTPIEVADLGGGRYGLISGWRRLTALRQLLAETGEPRFATVLALARLHASSEDAYVAMVEENEIRLGLSYWERARIAAKAVEAGIFGSEKIALQRLFAAASRSKRSKIGTFLGLYHGLRGLLRFPAALPERLGLALARGLDEDAALAPRLAIALRDSPPASAEAEQAVLAALLARRPDPGAVPDLQSVPDPVGNPGVNPESGPESGPEFPPPVLACPRAQRCRGEGAARCRGRGNPPRPVSQHARRAADPVGAGP